MLANEAVRRGDARIDALPLVIVPPTRNPCSTRTVRAPDRVLCKAAATPAVPPPTTTTSQSSSGNTPAPATDRPPQAKPRTMPYRIHVLLSQCMLFPF